MSLKYIYENDFTVIMGSSGSGKSTLLYALSGIDSINKGEILYKNNDITKISQNKMAQLRSNDFGFVFQQSNLVSNLTLFENVLVAGFLNNKYVKSNIYDDINILFENMNLSQ